MADVDRFVTGRADIIETQRRYKGLSYEELAAKAGVDPKTVRRAIKDNEVQIRSLKKIAVALDLNLQSVMKGPPSDARPIHQQGPIRIIIVCAPSSSDPPPTGANEVKAMGLKIIGEIEKQIKEVFRSNPDIQMIYATSGSIVIAANVDSDTLYRLCRLYVDGQLEPLGVISINIPPMQERKLQHQQHQISQAQSQKPQQEVQYHFENDIEPEEFRD